MTVEGALQMGDLHFADSVLGLLLEIGGILNPPASTRARLKSQRARILLARKQFEQAETELVATIKSLDPQVLKRSEGSAYCLLVLAEAYALQKKTEQAQHTHKLALAVAQECFAAQDPQLALFKRELPH